MQILNDLKAAAGLFVDMRKARKRGGAIKVEKKIQIPVIQSGGFYSTVEGCALSHCERREHEEFARRQDAENERQNRRIQLLEDNVRQINALTVSMEKMAVNMENMLAEQKRQGDRLEELEKEPVETHRQIKLAVISSVIGTVAGAIVMAAITLL